jgi:hypothetical protein
MAHSTTGWRRVWEWGERRGERGSGVPVAPTTTHTMKEKTRNQSLETQRKTCARISHDVIEMTLDEDFLSKGRA